MTAQPNVAQPNLGMQVTTFENPMGIDEIGRAHV